MFANTDVVRGKNLGNTGRYTKTIITAGNTLTRQQDNDHYQSKQSSISAGRSFTFGSMTTSG